jgi:hypothetical protein
MFKLLFFFFILFVIYKGLQFISKLYRLYDTARDTAQGRRNGQQQKQSNGYRKQYDNQTTIYYDPEKARKEEKSASTRGKSEDYIDYKEIKE